MTDPVVVGEEIKIIQSADVIPKTLWCQNSTTAGSEPFIDTDTGASYTVPVGKKLLVTDATVIAGQMNVSSAQLRKNGAATIIMNFGFASGTLNQATVSDWRYKVAFYLAAGEYPESYKSGNGIVTTIMRCWEMDA